MTEYFNIIKPIDYSVIKILHLWTFKTPSFALKFHIRVNLSFFYH